MHAWAAPQMNIEFKFLHRLFFLHLKHLPVTFNCVVNLLTLLKYLIFFDIVKDRDNLIYWCYLCGSWARDPVLGTDVVYHHHKLHILPAIFSAWLVLQPHIILLPFLLTRKSLFLKVSYTNYFKLVTLVKWYLSVILFILITQKYIFVSKMMNTNLLAVWFSSLCLVKQ